MNIDILDGLWGSGDLDRLFTCGAAGAVAPWPRAGRLRNAPQFDGDAVATMLRQPVKLVDVDPRDVWANQPGSFVTMSATT